MVADGAGRVEKTTVTITQRTDEPVDLIVPIQTKLFQTPNVVHETLQSGLNTARDTYETAVSHQQTLIQRIKGSYDEDIAQPVNTHLQQFRSTLSQQRQKNPMQIIAATAATAALLGTPFGRFAMVRNAALGGLFASWCTYPSTTTGALIVAADRIRGVPQQSTTVVVQRTITTEELPQSSNKSTAKQQ